MNRREFLKNAALGAAVLSEAKSKFGKKIALMGNLHTSEVMLYGSKQDVIKASINTMQDTAEGGGFILSTGDQCGRETPEENIFAMLEAAEKFGWYNQATGSLPDLDPKEPASVAREIRKE